MTRTNASGERWGALADVVPLRPRRARAAPEERRFVVVRVQCFADARELAERLMEQVPVLLDLSPAEPEVARRVLDFASGVAFGLDSAVHRVDGRVFLLTPVGTEVREQGEPGERRQSPEPRESVGGR